MLWVVMNCVKGDVRVMKEARALRAAGYEVQLAGITLGEDSFDLVHEGFPLRLVAYTPHSRNFGFINVLISFSLLELMAFLGLIAVFWVTCLLIPEDAVNGRVNAAALLSTIFIAAVLFKFRRPITNRVRSLWEFITYFTYTYRNEATSAVEEPKNDSDRLDHIELHPLYAIIDHGARSWIVRVRGMNRALCIALRQVEFDIVHCHDFTALPVGVWLKQEKSPLKLVYDGHELFSSVFADNVQLEWIRRFERRASSLIDAGITVNDSIARVLGEYYPKLPTPVVVCNATPKPTESAAHQDYDGRLHDAANIPRDCKILLFQGGLARHRGLAPLTAAGDDLPKNWRLVYMSAGNYERETRKLAQMADPEGDMIRFLPRRLKRNSPNGPRARR